MASSALHSSRSSQWFTAPWLLDAEREILGGEFDFDPASCELAQRLVRAERWHDGGARGNGLRVTWRARRMHLNAPYSRVDGGPIGAWVERALLSHVRAIAGADVRSGCLVVNSTPGPRWFRNLWDFATIAFLHERVAYIEAVPQALHRWIDGEKKRGRRPTHQTINDHAQRLLERGARARLPDGLTPGPAPTHWSAIAYLGSRPERVSKVLGRLATIIPAGAARVEDEEAA